MPIQQKQVLRYRGTVRVILRKLREVIAQIEANEQRYPEPPTNRRRLAFTLPERTQLTILSVKAFNMLQMKWPPSEETLLAAARQEAMTDSQGVPL